MATTAQDILNRLDKATKNFETGKQIGKANRYNPDQDDSNGNDGGEPEVVSKGANQQKRANFGSPIANGELPAVFESLAKKSAQFRHLGTDRVLEDPHGYLREKDPITGKYKVSSKMIGAMVSAQLSLGAGGKAGNPTLNEWKYASSNPAALETGLGQVAQKGMFGNDSRQVSKALDVSSGSALIRTDVEQLLHEIYLRTFPLDEFISKEPANGLVHTYDTRTDIGTATVINDLGDMSGSFSNSTYNRTNNAHIMTVVSPRGIGLKLQYAVSQSGMNFDLTSRTNLELVAAAQVIARTVQAYALQYAYTDAAGTKDNESGTYDALGMDGLRYLLRGAGSSLTKGATQKYIDVIDQGVAEMINTGAQEENLSILCSLGARRAVNAELTSFYRLPDGRPAGGVDNNLSGNGIATVADWVTKFLNVPANTQQTGLGYYTLGGVQVEDMYIVDPDQLAMAYLGSPTITTLELPVGFNNFLSQVYYPFYMPGLVCYAPTFLRKIRIPQTTV
jgi:hypothetical protein